MRHVDESVSVGDAGGPPLDFGALDFFGAAATAAYQMVMVVLAVAAPVQGLTVVGSQGVQFPGFGECAELVVDGGQPDVLASRPQLHEQVLGGAEPVGAVEGRGQGALLPGRALLGCSGRRVGGAVGHSW
jgi:hypothetical protein